MEAEAIEALMRYSWPGNIRQLENLIERLIVTTSAEKIKLQHLPDYILSMGTDCEESKDQAITVNQIIPLKLAVESVEKLLLQKTFSIANSCFKAAELLEVDASTISRKARKYDIPIKN